MMEENQRTLEFAARFASEKGIARYTRFLDPVQVAAAKQIAREHGAAFSVWGGYEQAERQIGCFLPWGEEASSSDFPLVCLHSIGDIIIVDSDIYLFVMAQTADFIMQGMHSAGKATLRFEPVTGEIRIPEPRGSCFHDTLSSLRLDAVVASAYRLSRNESGDMIRAGLVKLNHLPCDRVDTAVEEGAMLSVRSKGRIKLQKIEGLTRKQRIGVTFFRYE